jgi:integrase
VPLPPIVVNTLREWKLACPKSELGLVFPTGAGEIEYHSNIVTRGLGPAQIKAGVTVPVLTKDRKPVLDKDGKPIVKAKYTGLHALRHFYASWCINRKEDGGLGLPLKTVQHRLGHSTIQMTADVYGHLFPSSDDGAELAAAQKALLG